MRVLLKEIRYTHWNMRAIESTCIHAIYICTYIIHVYIHYFKFQSYVHVHVNDMSGNKRVIIIVYIK